MARPARLLALGTFLAGFVAAPFATNGIDRAFDVPPWAPWVVIGAGALLAIRRGPARWAGAGLVVGAAAFQVFLFWLFATTGSID